MRTLHPITKWAYFVFRRRLIDGSVSDLAYSANLSERVGEILLLPFRFPLKTFAKFFTWPTVFLIIAISSLIGSTIFYYPDHIAKCIEWIVPDISKEQVKLCFFIILQIYLNGLLLRTLGRLSNSYLKEVLKGKETFVSLD